MKKIFAISMMTLLTFTACLSDDEEEDAAAAGPSCTLSASEDGIEYSICLEGEFEGEEITQAKCDEGAEDGTTATFESKSCPGGADLVCEDAGGKMHIYSELLALFGCEMLTSDEEEEETTEEAAE